ncbi:2-aminoadipate transaminase-like isoform X2 [Mercenaria mercenaria]|uniref:2-aminoadipate transaminase-like isoform X2 n=1 Tax=Mercenaria mercenaria TaxID=6596 RepID=UPI00234F0370|nr:2-aminoadipate transaminase-like isoform X2 [Mercenaria mercenaria]
MSQDKLTEKAVRQLLYDESSVMLSVGRPGPTFPSCSDILTTATLELVGDPQEEQYTFQYGPCKGDPGFCDEVAKFLTEQYGDTVDSQDIMVTAGATQGLHLVATVMFDKDTPVFMEDPTYFIAVKILREDFGMNIIPIPTGDDGMDLKILEEQLKKHKPVSVDHCKTPFWGMVYTIPTFNNPKGYSMSPDRCRALVSLGRKYDVMLFAEDVYNLLHYSGQPHPPPRLLSFDKRSDEDFQGHVISNCTFSKILAPGLRTGWIEAPPRIMQYLEKSKTAWSGGSFNHYTSKLMATALRKGLLTSHLQQLREEYTERMRIACDVLAKKLPASVKCNNPQGGFFIWLELPAHIDAMELLQLAVDKYKVNFIFGASTSPTDSCKNCARLSISFCNKSQLQDGVTKFCDALTEMMNQAT